MKCPYCAEEDLKDEAIVCRHCGRDLGMYRAFAAKIADIEKTLSELAATVADLRLHPAADLRPRSHEAVVSTAAHLRANLLRFVAGLLGSVALAAALFLLVLRPLEAGYGTLGLFVDIITFNTIASVLGYWMGWRLAHSPPAYMVSVYVFFGIAFSYLSTWARIAIDTRFYHLSPNFFHRLKPLGVLFAILAPLLAVITGGLVASIVRRRRLGIAPFGLASRLAASLAGGGVSSPSAPRNRDGVKQLASVISAVAPLLTFVGALISSYFTYLAAIKK